MQQREVAYRRELTDRKNRVRKRAAEKLRTRWEHHQQAPEAHFGNVAAPSLAGEDPVGAVGRRPRPFLRQKWLDSLAKESRASSGALIANAADASSDKVKGGFAESQREKGSAVQRDHVRSVVQLALSEAKVNAFIVMSSLEGLLAVATEGLKGIEPSGILDNGAVGGSAITNDEGSRNLPSLAGSNLSAPNNVNTRLNATSSGSRAHRSKRKKKEVGESCSGAALCVKLGALPAVVGCLNEHVGHKVVEPLAMKLLYLFATDSTTREFVRGNAEIAAVCVARMFPFFAREQASPFGAIEGPLKIARPEATKKVASEAGQRFVSDGLVGDEEAAVKEGLHDGGKGESKVILPTVDVVFVLSVAVHDSLECQRLVLQHGGVAAMLTTIRKASEIGVNAGDAGLAGKCLQVLENLGSRREGRRCLVQEGSVEMAVSIIGRFRYLSTSPEDETAQSINAFWCHYFTLHMSLLFIMF